MKNYYFILGVSIYAKESEIKRAYRKLALKFHPDRNPDPDAETAFKEINEAYEVLSDISRKFLYDQMLVEVEPTPTPTTSTHRDPRYRPKPPGYAFKTDSNRKQLLDLMNRNLPYAVMISRMTLFFCVVLALDLLLPMKSKEVSIVNLTGVYGSNGLEYARVETSDGKKYRIRKGVLKTIDSSHEISVMTSRLLAVPVKLRDNVSNAVYRLYVSIYGNFIFFPCIWVITSLLGVFYEKGIEFRFNLGIVNALLTIFNLIILLISF